MHEKHKGHEAMHAEMMMILMVSLVVAQALLLLWRTKHARSYQVRMCWNSLVTCEYPCRHQQLLSRDYFIWCTLRVSQPALACRRVECVLFLSEI